MEIKFNSTDRDQILKDIRDAMGGRDLAKIVDLQVTGGELIVTISQLGTSKLTFKEKEEPDSLIYTLASEKIALAHRPSKNMVTKKILSVIEKAGGLVKA